MTCVENILNVVEKVNNAVNGFVWGRPALILLAFAGVLMTCLTKFFQVSHIGHWFKNTVGAIFKDKHITKHTDDKSISQFQSLCTALDTTVGTGNIAGIASAIAVGGPGAVFWMWVIAFFGMMTNYSENVLGILYRKKNQNGEWSGGAMYYLRDGLGSKKGLKHIGMILAVLFSCFCLLASFGIGNMTQVNTIAKNMTFAFNIPSIVTGIVLMILTGLVVVGGIKRIASVTEKIVPFMVVLYLLGTIVICCVNFTRLGSAFELIFKGAFALKAAGGAVVGAGVKSAIEMGMKRGVFSNEAGLGSSVMVHSSSNVKEPVRQGMWGIFEVFADTIIVCTLTALAILSSPTIFNSETGALNYTDYSSVMNEAENAVVIEANFNLRDETVLDNGYIAEYEIEGVTDKDWRPVIAYADIEGGLIDAEFRFDRAKSTAEKHYYDLYCKNVKLPKSGSIAISAPAGVKAVKITDTVLKTDTGSLVGEAFSDVFGPFGAWFIALALLLFAFSTVLGWSHYGTKACEYLFGTKSTIIYRVIFVAAVVGGAVMGENLAWDLSDTFNGLMMLPNLIGVLILSPIVYKCTKNYVDRHMRHRDIEPMLSMRKDIQKEQEAALVKDGME